MRAVWSFWSKPYRAGRGFHWHEPVHHLIAWGLSLRLAQAHYPEAVLITDSPVRALLIDGLGLPFAHVSTELDRLRDVNSPRWALGKPCLDFHRFDPDSPHRRVYLRYLFQSTSAASDPAQAARLGFTQLLAGAKQDAQVTARLAGRVRCQDPAFLPTLRTRRRIGQRRHAMTRTTSRAPADRRPSPQGATPIPRRDAAPPQAATQDHGQGLLIAPADACRVPVHPAEQPAPSRILHHDEPTVQRQAIRQAPALAAINMPPSVHEVVRSPGRNLPLAVRRLMEHRFGHDFGDVRVHTDAVAAHTAQAVGARAYTVGQDVVFSDGQFMPDSAEGRRLIAHELTHVIQQKAGGGPLPTRPTTVSSPSDAAEREADRVADTVSRAPGSGGTVLTTVGIIDDVAGQPPELQRQVTAEDDQTAKRDDDRFADDPLSAGGFGLADQTIRVRPGPVRTTLIRQVPPTRLRSKIGYTFRERGDDQGQPLLYDASKDDPAAWVDQFLQWAGFDWIQDPVGEVGRVKYVLRDILDDQPHNVAQFRNIVVGEALAEGLVLDPAVVDAIAADQARSLTPTSRKHTPDQLSIAWTFAPKQTSTQLSPPVKGDPNFTAAKYIQQIQGQFTSQFHPEDRPGLELSADGQVQITVDPRTKQVVGQQMIGGQAAAVTNFLTKFLQLSAVFEALGGVTEADNEVIRGNVQLTGQAALGVQGVVTVYELPDHTKIQLVHQAQLGLTGTLGGMVTFDRSTGFGIQIQFDLPTSP